MPQHSVAVSNLQQKVDIVIVGGLIHTNNILNIAKHAVAAVHRRNCLHIGCRLVLNRSVAETT